MTRDSLATTAFAKATVVKKNTKATKAMKPSGVAWLGDIPEGWEVDKAKRFFRQTNTRGNATPTLLAATQKYGMYPQDRLEGVVKVKEETDLQLFKTVHIDDFVISLRSFQGGFAHSSYEGVCSPAYQTFHATKVIWPRFYSYLFKSGNFIQMINSLTVGIREGKNINYCDFAECLMINPPLPEQRTIADYLDEKCGAIDAAIAEAKKGIEEYKAWKKAIIFEAVTGKANVLAAKNAKVAKRQMRDSGIPWIGEIPEGWEVKPLRRLGRLANGISKGGEYFGKGFPFVSYSDVYKNDAIPTQVKGLVEANDQERERYSVKRGDVFFTRTSETVDEIGIAAACLKDIQDSTFAGFLIRFRPMTDELLPEFSKYYFRNKLVSEYFAKELVMVTRASLGQELLKSLPVFIPPMKEQQAIADYLDEKCAAIDALVAEKEKLIADLEAYKKSLIFELVTGKREVA